MTRRELQLHRLTRSRQFLMLGTLAIGAIFGLLGLAAGWWRGANQGFRVLHDDAVGTLSIEAIVEHSRDPAGLAENIRNLAAGEGGPLEARRREAEASLLAANLPISDTTRLRLLADGLLGDAPSQEQALEALEKGASRTPPGRFDHEWLADVLSRLQRFDEAVSAYEIEGRVFTEADRARNRAVELALNRDDVGKLHRLLTDPAMTRDVDSWLMARAQARCGNYRGLFASTFRNQMEHWTSWTHTSIALLCGALWWLIFARIAGVPPRQWWLAVPALILGGFATTLTLVGQIVVPISFDENGDFLQRALFFVIGVGLREETLKLLCAIPLIVLLRHEKSANLAFIILCTVGLGFAIEENTSYFAEGPSPAWGRFLTANFLHLAWTGMVGFSLWRACRGATRGWEEFIGTFLLAVVSHGAYDLCFGDVMEENLSIISILIFVTVAFRYFTLLRSVAELSRQIVSPLAVFLFGSAVMLGLTFAGLCWAHGLRWATALLLGGAIGMAPMAFLFIREFRDD